MHRDRPLNSIVRQHEVETKMKPCQSRMPNPVSVETLFTSNGRQRGSVPSFAWGKAGGYIEASAEHRFINHRGELMFNALEVANARRQRFVAKRGLGSVACGGMLSNKSFETDDVRAYALRARPAAAQLDR